MDNLARNAMLAKQAGMSYGQWKAMQQPVKPQKKPIPDGWKECKGCGKAFKPAVKQQRYCDAVCREDAYSETNRKIKRDYMRRRRERMAG